MFVKQPRGHSIQKVCIWTVRVYLTIETYSSYHYLPSVHCHCWVCVCLFVLPNLRNSIIIIQLYLLPSWSDRGSLPPISSSALLLLTSPHPISFPCWLSNKAPRLAPCFTPSEKDFLKLVQRRT